MSLKESWQQQRQQRQQEVAQRQQQVQLELAVARQQREIQAAQLRADLSLFREAIAAENKVRRDEFQKFQSGLHQYCHQLQVQMQVFLAAASDRRQVQAQALAQHLDAFVHQVRQEVAQYLSATSAERALMAEQLEKDLTTFINALRVDVQSYLWEMETLRKNRAEQLHQELAQSRAERAVEMEALFKRFAEFRVELQSFCQALQAEVWGSKTSVVEQAVAKPAIAKPTAPKNGTQSTKVAEPTTLSIPTGVGAFPHGDSIAVVPVKTAKPAVKESVAYEKEVYNFIHDAHGARLTQIESSLGINRFQAVDALRSLIQKGYITQRDRVYLTQEQPSHT